jgi:hypothetical protein
MDIVCEICGAHRLVYPSVVKLGRGRFCSKKCATVWRNSRHTYRTGWTLSSERKTKLFAGRDKWLREHPEEMRKMGSRLPRRERGDDIARFLSKFEATNGCWVWHGCLNRKGYGQFGLAGKMCSAHRMSYEFCRGPIPDDFEIDHLCHEPSICQLTNHCPHRRCVNPWHMKLVMHLENTSSRRSNAGRRRAEVV